MTELSHVYGHLFASVFKLVTEEGDLKQRITAARDELQASICDTELPAELAVSYRAIMMTDVNALTQRAELVALAGRIVSLAFAACEAQRQSGQQRQAEN